MRIIVADDQKEYALCLAGLLQEMGHEIPAVVTAGGFAVIREFERHQPDVLLMDLRMPRLNGATICRHILSKHPAARVIVMSGGFDAQELGWTAASAGAVGVIQKPFAAVELAALLDSIASEVALEEEAFPLSIEESFPPHDPVQSTELCHV